MEINQEAINTIVEMVKKFFKDLIKPDMTIEKIAEIASPQLDKIIKQNEEQGLKYSAGKFKIEYADDAHFTLEFEMYFKDDAGKWYKASNKSELRDAELIEPSSWKTLKALKVIEFPIGAPVDEKTKNAAAKSVIKATESTEENKSTANESSADNSDIQNTSANAADNKADEITLDKLMGAKK